MRRLPGLITSEVIALSAISLFLLSFVGSSLFKKQLIYIIIGFILMYFILYFDFRELKYFSLILYFSGIFLLIIVLLVGKTTYGAQRWISIGNLLTVQPSEFEKLILILTFADIVAKDIPDSKKFIMLGFSFLIPFLLIFKEPDLGTDIVLFAIFLVIMFFFINIKYTLTMLVLVVSSIPFGLKLLKPYQLQRIKIFLDPQKDPMGSGYNVIQSIVAIGSGMLFGKGISKSVFTKLHFVPVQYADFIFSALGEIGGFIGTVILLLIYIGILLFLIKTYSLTTDTFGKAIIVGIFSMFIAQIFINIGMCIGIMPVTGIPLPFVSFGGSGTLTDFIAIGLAINIYIYREEINISI